MKFSIRDLFLVTVIVAICLAWWLDRRSLVHWGTKLDGERRKAVFEAELLRGFANGSSGLRPDLGGPPNSSAPAPNPPNP